MDDEVHMHDGQPMHKYLRWLQDTNDTDTIVLGFPTPAPSLEPTSVIEQFVTSNDTNIIKETFRFYGSIYLVFFVFFCIVRKKCPRLYNIRSWVPDMKCTLAETEYGYIDWSWKVFRVSDDEILDNCGMDALCFLRCLRLGLKLSALGAFNAIWLIPVYLTAPESAETSTLTDKFVLMSIANLPKQSTRFIAPVFSVYVIVLYSMYLISKEYDWYIEYRHKYLSKREPRNYAIYVSGIPHTYRSSYALADYFRQCTSWSSSVLEAHIAMDIPTLESKVAKRDKLVATIEHVMAIEKKKGHTHTHRTMRFNQGIEGVKKVESVRTYLKELETLNNQIALTSGHVTRSNHRMRQHLTRSEAEVSKLNPFDLPQRTSPKGLQMIRSNSEPNLVRDNGIPPVVVEEAEDTVPYSRIDHSGDIEEGSSSSTESLGTTIDQAIFGPDASKHPSNTVGLPMQYDEVIPSRVAHQPAPPLRRQLSDPSMASTHKELRSAPIRMPTTSTLMDDEPNKAASESNIELSPEGKVLNFRKIRRSPLVLREVGANVVQGARRVGTGTVAVGAHAYSNVKRAGQVGAQTVLAAGSIGVTGVRKAADFGIQKIQKAPDLGVTLAATAAAVVPMRLTRADGKPREAGFVVFNDLYTTQAARQMLQHPSTSKMVVEPAPDPEEIFWPNVGLPAEARRSGFLLSMVATSVLCFFWSIPMAFLSSLTEVNSLKEKLPLLAKWVDDFPALDSFLALIAPVLLLLINEIILPVVLKWFATWEGHVAASVLEASLFVKLCTFVFIQTFFISAVSGTITAELSNILDNPEDIVDLLANSLPAQSSYFIQICFVFTFLLQGLDLIRAYPLWLAFLRRFCFGPRLTIKERKKTWKWINSLEDPPEFWHAEILAQVMLFFVVFFVYATIAPITSLFLGVCFVLCESGYRYHFVHNQRPTPDSGGKLWVGFINVLIASMLIGEITLFGMLILKKTVYATSALAPLGVMTILFMIFEIPKRNYVADNLPTLLCVQHDKRNTDLEKKTSDFASSVYLQPALRAEPLYPEEPELADSVRSASR